jgi:hypothetical protein
MILPTLLNSRLAIATMKVRLAVISHTPERSAYLSHNSIAKDQICP